jgi:hypothetical protein
MKSLRVKKCNGRWVWRCFDLNWHPTSVVNDVGYTEHWLAADAARIHWHIAHQSKW